MNKTLDIFADSIIFNKYLFYFNVILIGMLSLFFSELDISFPGELLFTPSNNFGKIIKDSFGVTITQTLKALQTNSSPESNIAKSFVRKILEDIAICPDLRPIPACKIQEVMFESFPTRGSSLGQLNILFKVEVKISKSRATSIPLEVNEALVSAALGIPDPSSQISKKILTLIQTLEENPSLLNR